MRSLTLIPVAAVVCALSAPAIRATAADEALVKTLTPAALAVLKLVAADKFDPRMDELVRRAPNAEALGAKWTPALPAFQKARTAISSRIAKVMDIYGKADQLPVVMRKKLDDYFPAPEAAALASALNGPNGPGIIYYSARSEFTLAAMEEDRNGPKVGDPAWMKRLGDLNRKFEEKIGPTVPAPDPAKQKEIETFISGARGQKLSQWWMSTISFAMNDLDTGIQLMIFDDRDAIMKEINAAIATVK